MGTAQDILILSNGPGEITTWVRPVVRELRKQLSADRSQLRISIILSPCPNATGKEEAIARSYPEVDRTQGATEFFSFLLWGKTKENWDWRDRGVVLFLGGDQLFPVIISKRLGYRTIIYSEWEARWYRWIDRFGVMNAKVAQSVPSQYRHKITVVGDLMADVETNPSSTMRSRQETVGVLPGSKGMKLKLGIPLMLAAAEAIHRQRPQTRFLVPIAPTVDLDEFARYADPQHNRAIAKLGNVSATVAKTEEGKTCLQTSGGLQLELLTQFPAYDRLSQCDLCLTTVGANTAELGARAIPMLVFLPAQQLNTMKAWDGIPGLLANLPLIGSGFAYTINWAVLQYLLRNKRLYAWPNLWAGEEIVPEFVGILPAEEIARLTCNTLEQPEKLGEMRDRLRDVRGETGAAAKLAQLVAEELESDRKTEERSATRRLDGRSPDRKD